MDIDACIKKIDRHLANDNVQPLIVDVQNRTDLTVVCLLFIVGTPSLHLFSFRSV